MTHIKDIKRIKKTLPIDTIQFIFQYFQMFCILFWTFDSCKLFMSLILTTLYGNVDIKAEATSFKDFVIAIKIFLLNSLQKNLWHVLGQEKYVI